MGTKRHREPSPQRGSGARIPRRGTPDASVPRDTDRTAALSPDRGEATLTASTDD